MKKTIYGIGAMSLAALMFSCTSQDMPDVTPAGDSVSFEISLSEETGSRAFDDGVTGAVGDEGVTKLYYNAYYRNSGSTEGDVADGEIASGADKVAVFTTNGEATLVDGKASINISLPKGRDYVVAFWAQNPECLVWNTTDLRAVEFKTENLKNNDITVNAFSGHCTIINSNHAGAQHPHQVRLTRAVAQLNVGADLEMWEEFEKTAEPYTKSGVTIKDVPTRIDVLTGLTDLTSTTTVQLAETEFFAGENRILKVPHDDFAQGGEQNEYRWVSMCYIPAGRRTNTNTVDATFTFTNQSGSQSASVQALNLPIQRNYRTNILGRVLSETEPFEVILDREWAGNDNSDLKVDPNKFTEKINRPGQNVIMDLGGERLIDAANPNQAREIICNDLTIKNGVLGAGQIKVIATGTVTLEDIKFETKPENTNAVFTEVYKAKRIMVNSAKELILRNIDTEGQVYARNGLELTPMSRAQGNNTPVACEKITIENCNFVKMDNNCLSLYIDNPDVEINITNCKFGISNNVTGSSSLALTGQPGQPIRISFEKKGGIGTSQVNAKINIEDCAFEYIDALTYFPERPEPNEGKTHITEIRENAMWMFGLIGFDAYAVTTPDEAADLSNVKLSFKNIKYGLGDDATQVNVLDFQRFQTLFFCSYPIYTKDTFFKTVTLDGVELPINPVLSDALGAQINTILP